MYETLKYEVFERSGDIYCLFIEKAMKLLKPGGYLGFIISNKWMRAKYGKKLRRFLSNKNPILIVDLGPNVFEEATVDTCIIIVQNCDNRNELYGVSVNEKITNLSDYVKQNKLKLDGIGEDIWFIGNETEEKLKEKIEQIGKPLKKWNAKIYFGIKTGFNEAFIIDKETRNKILNECKTEEERRITSEIIKPVLRGRDIGRYYYKWAGSFAIVIPSGWTNQNRNGKKPEKFISEKFPALMNYIKKFEEKSKSRYDQGDYWWELRSCDYYQEFENEKILWQEIVREPSFTYDNSGIYCEATTFLMTGSNLKYLLGILNSKPGAYFFKTFYAGGGLGEKGYRYKKIFLEKLPIPLVNPKIKFIVSKIDNLVDKMLSLNKNLNQISDKKANERTKIEEKIKEEIERTDKKIDELIYKIYNITDKEKEIIEVSLGSN